MTELVIEQSVRARTASAIELRDQGRHGEAQALFQQNVKEIEAQAASAPLSDRLQYLKQQYRGIVAAPPASPTARSDQRKFLRQMDFEPGGAGLALLIAQERHAAAGPHIRPAAARRLDYDPALNDFDQYSTTCPTKAGGSGT